jgi:hypothetical protein
VKMICAIEFYILLFKSKIANGAVIIIGSHMHISVIIEVV